MGRKPRTVSAGTGADGVAENRSEPADQDSTGPERQLGPQLCKLRTARGLTQDQLAAETGFTKGYLSKIENAKVIPPIGTLVKIVRALETDLANLFRGKTADEQDDAICIDRADDHREIIRGGNAFGYDYVALADKRPSKQMEPFIMIFPAGVEKDVRFDHEGEELMFILSGQVELSAIVERQVRTWVLSPGDSAYFDSSIPHRGRSLQGESRALVVIYRSKRAMAATP